MPDALPDLSDATPDLADSTRISFLRSAGSPGAAALVSAVVELIRPNLGSRAQAAGKKGHARLTEETSIILGGVLSKGLRNRAVAAHRRPAAFMWKTSPFGFRAFWSKVEAMEAAGLVNRKGGISYVNVCGVPEGEATRLWPTQRLLDLAAGHGCIKATLAQDWPVTRDEQRRELDRSDLVTFSTPRKGAGSEAGSRIDPPDGSDHLADLLQRLNATAAAATITGCSSPSFQRRFIGSTAFGGRFYASGSDSFQVISKAERRFVQVNGEPVAEADLSASFLSIFLALAGAPPPSPDPYELTGPRDVPRVAVKQWFLQTLQTGTPCVRWSPKAPPEARSVSPSVIRRAALATYPALSQLGSWLPQQLRNGVAPDQLGWAGAMRLQAIESDIIADTMTALMDAGGVALPLHDAVLVPASWAQRAAEELQRAFTARIGRPVTVKIKTASFQENDT